MNPNHTHIMVHSFPTVDLLSQTHSNKLGGEDLGRQLALKSLAALGTAAGLDKAERDFHRFVSLTTSICLKDKHTSLRSQKRRSCFTASKCGTSRRCCFGIWAVLHPTEKKLVDC